MQFHVQQDTVRHAIKYLYGQVEKAICFCFEKEGPGLINSALKINKCSCGPDFSFQ
jgi:hypothetical protein